MLKSCVSSYVFNVYPIRKENNRVTLENRFGESENLDIIDVIEERLKNGEAFKIENIRFGEGTEADNEATREAVSEENKGLTTETTKAKIRLKKIIRKGIARDDDATSLYKYLLFTVTYGENGDRGNVERPDGTSLEVKPDDFYCRVHHVLIAYLDDAENPIGIAYFESRGNHSIVTTMRKVMQCAVRDIYGEKYVLRMTPLTEDRVVKKMISESEVKELTLIKAAEPAEVHGGMQYTEARMSYIYPKMKRGNLRERLVSWWKGGIHAMEIEEDAECQQLKDFEPDIIKFKIAAKNGRERTFTAGKQNAGVVQEILPDEVVMADGYTNSDEFLKAVDTIIREQHID